MDVCRLRFFVLLLTGAVLAAGAAAAGFPDHAGAEAPLSAPVPPGDPLASLLGHLTDPAETPPGPEPGQIARPFPGGLPLGRSDLRERRSTKHLAPGVTLTTIRRGNGKAKRARIADTRGGPWLVNVLTIDPREADGRLTTTFGRTLAGLDRTTALIKRADALAGVNGSFFSLRADRRYPGLPVGLTIRDGRVLSKPTGTSQEVTLALDSEQNTLRIGQFIWSGNVRSRSGQGSMALDRLNSPPTVPRGCARAKAAAKPRCAGSGQLAAFTSDFAGRTPAGPGVEIVLDSAGCPMRVVRHRGVKLRRAQTSLQGTGATAARLRSLAAGGCVDTEHSVHNRYGWELPLRSGVSAVTGRFRLMRQGQIVLSDRGASIFGRNPRTIAGVDPDGKLMLVTIDGRQPRSVGATLWEAARVARALGMWDAINLDGGGSTAMAVRGHLVNRPAGSERSVSDALVWQARKD
ncbi:MAG TPA: phosphodiester glycosidase family protein [Sporichthya sp.]|nr:phosphodiester glycosidase family protein [Sporichthya sp.]